MASSPLSKSAQRLSASTEGTLLPHRDCKQFSLVLNAFRHQRKEHPRSEPRRQARMLCSTPFGINGRNTPSESATTLKSWCAQRLSASTEGTPGDGDGKDVANGCSTPFGINGRNTSVIASLCRLFDVLNAFRHQRKEHLRHRRAICQVWMCSTPFGINGRNTVW